jgi:hypothetical protein
MSYGPILWQFFLKYGRGWLSYDNFSIGKICDSEIESSLLESVSPVQIMEADPKEKKVTERGGGAERGGVLGEQTSFFSTWDFHQSNFPESNPLG